MTNKVLVGIASSIVVAVGSAVALKAVSLPGKLAAVETRQTVVEVKQASFEASTSSRFDSFDRKLDIIIRRLPRGRE